MEVRAERNVSENDANCFPKFDENCKLRDTKILRKSKEIRLKQTTPKHIIIKTGEKGRLKKDKRNKEKKTPFLQGNK